jgi:hypothetical protein
MVKTYHVTESGLVEGPALGRISVVLLADYEKVCEEARLLLDEQAEELYQRRFHVAELEAILRDEATRIRLTSLPLKLEFAKARGFNSLEAVHEWMSDVSKRMIAVTQTT